MPIASYPRMSINRRSPKGSRLQSACTLLVVTLAGLGAFTSARPAVAAAEIQPLDSIRNTAESYMRAQVPDSAQGAGRRVIVTAGYLDTRLRLARCDGKLTASRPPGSTLSQRNTVAVACSQTVEWTIYVPVMLESEGPVLVTRHAVARGSGLTAADVESQVQRVPGLATHYVADATRLSGRHAKRALPAGTPISEDALATNLLVKRGQQVTLLAAVGGIEVRATGRAMTDGAATDRIRVQNMNSTRIVEGFVESADIVRIAP